MQADGRLQIPKSMERAAVVCRRRHHSAAVDPLARQFPAAGTDPYTLALAGKTLYLEDNTTGTVWAAQMPSAPR